MRIAWLAVPGWSRVCVCSAVLAALSLGAAWAQPAPDCKAPAAMKESITEHPTAEVFRDLGALFIKRLDYPCAVQAFAASLQIEPHSAEVSFLFGSSLYFAGDVKEAIGALEYSESLDPARITTHSILAAAYDNAGQTSQAEAEWRAALLIDPKLSSALDGLSQDLLLDHDHAAVIALLHQPSRREERTMIQSLNLALAYVGGSDPEKAAAVLAGSLGVFSPTLQPARLVEAHLAIARSFEQLHRAADAERQWRAALDLDAEDTEALEGLSSDMLRENDYSGTVALLGTERLAPLRTTAMSLNLADAYAALGKMDEAAGVLNDGLDSAPDSVPLANRFADMLVQLNRVDEAVGVFEAALLRHPGDEATEAHCLRVLLAAKSPLAAEAARGFLEASPGSLELKQLAARITDNDAHR